MAESRDPMTRLRWIVVGLFALCHLAIPAVFIELYPFSAAPILTKTVSTITIFEIFDAANKRVPPASFELAMSYFGTFPETGLGKQKPRTINHPNRVLGLPELAEHVRTIARARAMDAPFITVRQKVLGSVDGNSVGWVSNSSWRIDLR